MNATELEAPEQRSHAEEEARVVMGLLREYSGKLAALTAELHRVLESPRSRLSEAAWLLDQSEILRKPLAAIISRGSALRESAKLESLVRDELSLRMWETEVHLHHTMRRTHLLRESLAASKLMEQVAAMRITAGLPAAAVMP